MKSDPLCPTPKPRTGFLPTQGLRVTAGLLISCQMFPGWAPKQQSVSSSHTVIYLQFCLMSHEFPNISPHRLDPNNNFQGEAEGPGGAGLAWKGGEQGVLETDPATQGSGPTGQGACRGERGEPCTFPIRQLQRDAPPGARAPLLRIWVGFYGLSESGKHCLTEL